jgi:hypothetical protein
MIYSENFIWVHFPKIAGTKIEEIFKKYYSDVEDISQDIVGEVRTDGSQPWHDSIADRLKYDPSFKLEGKKIIVCIRRLPNWLISRYNFEVERSKSLPHSLDELCESRFLEANGYLNQADYYIKKYLPKHFLDKPELTFIRMENFEEDFKSAFKDVIDLDLIPKGIFQKKSNVSKNHIDSTWLDDEKIRRMYATSPFWTAIEKLAY